MRNVAATGLILGVVMAGGCGKTQAPIPAAGPAARAAGARTVAVSGTNLLTMPPGTVLARVNGQELTLGQAKKEIAERFAEKSQTMPPSEWERQQPELLGQLTEQFVMRTLLLEEAERQQITVDAQDESNAFVRIQQRLPPGKTVAQVMKESPLGEARMKAEVMTGIRINKLLAKVLPEEPVVTDQDLAEFAKKYPDIKLPETVAASHILMKIAPTDDAAALKAKREKLDGIRKKILAGGDFAALARENSECPSAQRGGDLGVFRKGQMVPAFEAAAFSQKPGQVGDIVETKFGYHLILVTKHDEPGPVPPERLRLLAQKEKGKKAYDDFLVGLRSKGKVEIGPFPAGTGK
jgi:peptidyl-prolyl cis-trans isomerase C